MIREWKRLIGEGKILQIKGETKIAGGERMPGGERLEAEEIYEKRIDNDIRRGKRMMRGG